MKKIFLFLLSLSFVALLGVGRVYATENPTTPTNLRWKTLLGEELECNSYTNSYGIVAMWDESYDVDGIAYYQYESFNPTTGWVWGPVNVSTNERSGSFTVGEGTYGFRVRAVDNEGYYSEWSSVDFSSSCKVTYDETSPEAPIIISPNEEDYFNSTPILNDWSDVSDSTGIDYYRIEYKYDDNHSFSGFPYRTISSSQRNHTPAEWEEGGVSFRVQAFDMASNEGAWSDWRHYYYDITPPTITLNPPIAGNTYWGEIDLTATCDEECDYINFWWRMDGKNYSNVSPEKNYHYVYDNGLEFNWTIDSLNAERWGEDPSYPLDDGKYYFYAAGTDLAGNWARSEHIPIHIDNDLDNDGVLNYKDKCKDTDSESSLYEKLGVNRWIWDGEEEGWITTEPKGNANGYDKSFSMEDTYGCSCTQILHEINMITGDELGGHYKFGCSQSIIEAWRDNLYYVGPTYLETVSVPATGGVVSSTNTMKLATKYFLRASGTYRFANWRDYGIADAEWAYRSPSYYPTDPFYAYAYPDTEGLLGGWVKGEGYYSSQCGLDVQVDGTCQNWGDFETDHKYEIEYEGKDDFVDFFIYDNAYGDNSGFISVDIFEDKWISLW